MAVQSANQAGLVGRLWKMKHIRESQYMVQVVKCSDRVCCSQPRSSYFSFIKDGFHSGPWPIEHTVENGLRVTFGSPRFPFMFVRLAMNADLLSRSAASYPKGIPFEFAYSNRQEKLMQRVCKQCGLYHA